MRFPDSARFCLPSWRGVSTSLNPGPHFRVRAFAGANARCAAPAHPALAAFVRPCTASAIIRENPGSPPSHHDGQPDDGNDKGNPNTQSGQAEPSEMQIAAAEQSDK